jgi:sialidase-1
MNSRHADPPGTSRGLAVSDDGGLTWSPMRYEPALPEPEGGCQGSMIALPNGRLLFSNPASSLRERMTIHTSDDSGVTWAELAVLHAGPAAYSSLALLPDGYAACLYECGDEHPYQTITFQCFTL